MLQSSAASRPRVVATGVAMVYGMMALATRVKGYASPYVEAM